MNLRVFIRFFISVPPFSAIRATLPFALELDILAFGLRRRNSWQHPIALRQEICPAPHLSLPGCGLRWMVLCNRYHHTQGNDYLRGCGNICILCNPSLAFLQYRQPSCIAFVCEQICFPGFRVTNYVDASKHAAKCLVILNGKPLLRFLRFLFVATAQEKSHNHKEYQYTFHHSISSALTSQGNLLLKHLRQRWNEE
jgi:hypothetical protein